MTNIKYQRPQNHITDPSWSRLILNQPHGAAEHLTTGGHCCSPPGAGCAQKRSLKRLFLCRGRVVNPEKLENVDLLGPRFVDYYCWMTLHIEVMETEWIHFWWRCVWNTGSSWIPRDPRTSWNQGTQSKSFRLNQQMPDNLFVVGD